MSAPMFEQVKKSVISKTGSALQGLTMKIQTQTRYGFRLSYTPKIVPFAQYYTTGLLSSFPNATQNRMIYSSLHCRDKMYKK
jgi:hypothetical protein